ncbi:hypothetical protein LZ318_28435 [Saccharopolyspora indica]|uniref:hypothetical protein n=1 Tax=Saccharopolyspora indica TaxID=1229659 RepID=UPI0022EA7375|nr:hypothetical protein [Saccharopolyspora indica]MDA3645666.1 hypothetical protein [Saccharopolyspora indica]
MPILAFVDVDAGVSGHRARPEIELVSFLADMGRFGVAVCGVCVVVAVEEDFAAELEQVTDEGAQPATHVGGLRFVQAGVERGELVPCCREDFAFGSRLGELRPQLGVQPLVGVHGCGVEVAGVLGGVPNPVDIDRGDG